MQSVFLSQMALDTYSEGEDLWKVRGVGKDRGAASSFSDKGQGKAWVWSNLKHTRQNFPGFKSRQEMTI